MPSTIQKATIGSGAQCACREVEPLSHGKVDKRRFEGWRLAEARGWDGGHGPATMAMGARWRVPGPGQSPRLGCSMEIYLNREVGETRSWRERSLGYFRSFA
ncbi:hypothetical protein TcasGA2_TC001028 [Tribolium castaneum]|uniref:Uncharacterized protein n=1 Tax=Tribolium castaneum TaxID=7070 RepID=D6W9P8_TRICA|nr:hypothetical protein TcasGA2_TC001028 [Tribolium castaneum]